MRNENIGFYFEVKGETFSPIAKEYFQDQKANLENEVNLFSFINLCVEGSVPQGGRRSQKDTQMAAAGVLACNHCRAGQREGEKQTPPCWKTIPHQSLWK